MFQLNGNPISIDSEQVINGVRYPHLRDRALRERLGITEVADAPAYDQRFYWSPDNPKLLNDREEVDQDGNPMWVQTYDPATETMVNTDKRLVAKGLKSQWIAQVKDTAGKMLAQTDWMITRKVERGVEVPVEITEKRQAIVSETDRLETAIMACASVEELIVVVSNQGWPNDKI